MKRLLCFCFLVTQLVMAEPLPPGPNVHHVHTSKTGTLWRGGGPREATLEYLHKSGRPVTFIDLRHPANEDDRSGKDNRLSPAKEEQMARKLGMDYRSISALDSNFIPVLDKALAKGDVYIHCMYGVNRTGFAVGRFATAHKLKVDRAKLGERDYNDGAAFQRRVGR